MNCTWSILSVLRINAVFVLVLQAGKPNTEGSAIPDVSKLPSYHYLDVFHTQLVDSNKLRSPDDFMSRAVVKKLFKEGELQNMEDIKTFANQHAVKAEMVNMKHLKNIEFTKQLRATVTKNEANTRKTRTTIGQR